jgi:hypothetical protein
MWIVLDAMQDCELCCAAVLDIEKTSKLLEECGSPTRTYGTSRTQTESEHRIRLDKRTDP